jgi:glycine/D-amino acid oxidase-like deaminating enzyme
METNPPSTAPDQPSSRRPAGPPDDRPPVVGGGRGVCGLTAAVALERRGASPTVCETDTGNGAAPQPSNSQRTRPAARAQRSHTEP